VDTSTRYSECIGCTQIPWASSTTSPRTVYTELPMLRRGYDTAECWQEDSTSNGMIWECTQLILLLPTLSLMMMIVVRRWTVWHPSDVWPIGSNPIIGQLSIAIPTNRSPAFSMLVASHTVPTCIVWIQPFWLQWYGIDASRSMRYTIETGRLGPGPRCPISNTCGPLLVLPSL
jgi:hypothetical protein